jgi:predicted RNase H-like HicB family nuclease
MSSTLTLPVPPTRRPSLASQADSLAEARELLRRAARLPYHATRADAWARRFRRLTSDATAAIGQHVLRLQRSEVTGMAADGTPPHRLPALHRQAEEAENLIRAGFDLVHEAEAVHRPDIWNMVELGEQAMRLSIAVERHHNRLLDMAFEAGHRDIGGGG